MRTARTMLAMVVAALLALSAAGCGGGADRDSSGAGGADLVAKAKAEGEVTWYNVLNPALAQNAAKAFTDTYGIKVQIFRGISADVEQRYMSERDSGNTVADVLSDATTAPYTGDAKPGEFIDLTSRSLPSMAAWPADQVFGKVTVPIQEAPFVLAYNTNKVQGADVPTDWKSVMSPALRDSVAVPTYSAASVYTDFLYVLDKAFGDDFLKELGTLKPTRYDSGVPALQAISAGEQKVLLPTSTGLSVPVIKSGAPVAYVIPPTTPTATVFAGVPSQAPHPNAALLLLDFLMSKDGQVICNKDIGASALGELPGTLKRGAGWTRPDSKAAAADRARLLALVGG